MEHCSLHSQHVASNLGKISASIHELENIGSFALSCRKLIVMLSVERVLSAGFVRPLSSIAELIHDVAANRIPTPFEILLSYRTIPRKK
jgi:hypothetical protein